MFSFFVVCLILFNTSCGLDTYEVIDAPILYDNDIVTYDELSKAEQYFEFYTNEGSHTYSEVKFLGTDVYYKIYNNYQTSLSERSALENIANSTNTAGAADKLIISYNYKPLKASNYNGDVLIPAGNSKAYRLVRIRLTDYQDIYHAEITVDGDYIKGSTGVTAPLRSFDELTFNFFNEGISTDNKDKIPVKDDEDVKYGTATEDGKWYVNLFAVAVARDMTYSNQYSNILYLGTVTISTDKTEN